jgi:Distinct helicase family with a unique C-terminal domain including a metal-binding cysteine cluster
MHDLIGSYKRLERLYRLYIESAFPLRSAILAEERDAVLHKAGVLSQPPVVETVPVYPLSGLNLAEAVQQLPSEFADLAALGQQLFPSDIELYRHQWQSLYEAVVQHRDIVVTTGTGSGKTECFLLPLFAQLARESAFWPAAGSPPPNYHWWNQETNLAGERVSQWGHTTRPKALRAVILYPLNALVEDQLRRLRMALDDNDVHRWLDRKRGGNRITFGRYTGLTPVAGRENTERRERLRKELEALDQQRCGVIAALQQDPKRDQDIQYYFPRMDGGEMWSRWDMQEVPPDILITNYSMLNITLMRSIENDIFEKTKAWLAEEGHPEREFFLIIDELHAYRGTPGTEVAYILRLLLYRLGLKPDSPKLRILTTTANLEGDDQSKKFLREFFGRDRFAFIVGEQMLPQEWAGTFLLPYQAAFEQFARAVQPKWKDGPPDPAKGDIKTQMAELAARLGRPASPGESEEERLGEALFQVNAHEALRDACHAVHGTVRSTQAPKLDAQLFPAVVQVAQEKDEIVSDAFRGLLLALGMSRRKEKRKETGRSPQPLRGHLFYHNLQNLWACCNPNCDDEDDETGAYLVKRAAAAAAEQPPIGAIHATHRIACGCGARVLDLIVCEVCGDVFLGGYKAKRRVGTQELVFLTPDQPDLEHMPDRIDLTQRHETYTVFWPLPHDPPWQVEPLDTEWTIDGVRRRWVKGKLTARQVCFNK